MLVTPVRRARCLLILRVSLQVSSVADNRGSVQGNCTVYGDVRAATETGLCCRTPWSLLSLLGVVVGYGAVGCGEGGGLLQAGGMGCSSLKPGCAGPPAGVLRAGGDSQLFNLP